MMAFTKDGQLKEGLVTDRDRYAPLSCDQEELPHWGLYPIHTCCHGSLESCYRYCVAPLRTSPVHQVQAVLH